MDNQDIENFLTEEAKKAESVPDRDIQLERIKSLWEHYKGEDRIVTSYEILESLETEDPQHKVLSGWESVDKLTGGFTYEELIVVSAQEKSGKTAWVLQLVDKIKGEEPCCFLFEQSPKQIIRQMRDRGQEIPYFVTPLQNTDNRFGWFEKRAMEAMVKRGSRLFVIDNVDWLQKEYGHNQRSDEAIKDLLLKLKSFCTRWGVIIILIAHVRKIPMQEIPEPDDIKDTGAFKQIADTVIILWRKTREAKVEGTRAKAPYRTNETLVWVAENRRTGDTGYAQLVFKDGKYFEEVWDENLNTNDGTSKYDSDF